MQALNIPALVIALVSCLAMASLGGLLAGKQVTGWFATLRKPRLQLPLWAFISVGGVVYVLDALILYRLLTGVNDQALRIVALTGMYIVMLYNELWNYVFLGWRNTFAGFLGVLAFLAPLLILQVTLLVSDQFSALVLFVYLLWVIGYDIPWAYTLWKLNPPGVRQGMESIVLSKDRSEEETVT